MLGLNYVSKRGPRTFRENKANTIWSGDERYLFFRYVSLCNLRLQIICHIRMLRVCWGEQIHKQRGRFLLCRRTLKTKDRQFDNLAILSSLVETTYGGTSDNKVIKFTTFSFQRIAAVVRFDDMWQNSTLFLETFVVNSEENSSQSNLDAIANMNYLYMTADDYIDRPAYIEVPRSFYVRTGLEKIKYIIQRIYIYIYIYIY